MAKRATKRRLPAWVVSDAFWERVEPLIPQPAARPRKQKFVRKPGGGRKPKDPRVVFAAHCVRVAHGLSVEGAAGRTLR